MQGHLETVLETIPTWRGEGDPPPISCPGTVTWEQVPGGRQGQGGGHAQCTGNREERAWEAVGSSGSHGICGGGTRGLVSGKSSEG